MYFHLPLHVGYMESGAPSWCLRSLAYSTLPGIFPLGNSTKCIIIIIIIISRPLGRFWRKINPFVKEDVTRQFDGLNYNT